MEKFCIVFSTVGRRKDAERIAMQVVRKRVAACVNILPINKSIYRWKGEICKEKEFLLIFKTTKSKSKSLMQEIKSIHPYKIPEIIELPIVSGLKEYLKWIEEEIE